MVQRRAIETFSLGEQAVIALNWGDFFSVDKILHNSCMFLTELLYIEIIPFKTILHLQENPAPTPTADASPPTEQPKAAPAPAADHIQKRKNRQSLSISKSAQAEISQHVEAPPAPAARTKSAADTPTTVTTNVAGSPPAALRELPALRDAPPNKREELFKLKLQLCGVIFSFDDPTSDKRGKVSLILYSYEALYS